MTRASLSAGLTALLAVAAPCGHSVAAQEWSIDLYAGGAQVAALADLAESNIVGNLRYDAGLSSVYLSAAAPLSEEAVGWAAGGASGRFGKLRLRGVGWGILLDADAYAYHDAIMDVGGIGVTLHGAPFVMWHDDRVSLELRAGRREHLYHRDGSDDTRGVVELAARAEAGLGPLIAIAETRQVLAPEANYPYAGVQLVAEHGPGRLWATGGRWFDAVIDESGWSAGASFDVLRGAQVWGAIRRETTDPLYQSVARRSWSIGVSITLRRTPAAPESSLAPVQRNDRVLFRLPFRFAPRTPGGSADPIGAPAIAGDFNRWEPHAMTETDDGWQLELPLSPGVYHFSFIDAAGEWFVPDGYPGRVSDGMGGFSAVLIVR